MNFPDYFPPNCPLDGHQPIKDGMVVYRFVKGISTKELRSHKEKGNVDETDSLEEVCKRCAVSVFTSLSGIRAVGRFKFKGYRIAKITLSKDWGRIKLDNPSDGRNTHCNWWVYDAINREDIIKEMELVS